MNDPELDRLLRSARLPPGTEDNWKDFAEGVTRRLRTEAPHPPRRRRWRPGAIAALAAVAGLALGFGLWHRPVPPQEADDTLQDGGVLRQWLARYPGRLQSIVQNRSGRHFLLSDRAGVVTSDPVWLEIREGQDRRIVVTFSGQEISCGGRQVMVLSDPAGRIILVGEGFFWSDSVSAGQAEKVQIRAVRMPDPSASDKPSLRL